MKFRKIIICIILFSMLIQTFSFAADTDIFDTDTQLSITEEQTNNLLYMSGSINVSPTGGTVADILIKTIFVQLFTVLNMPAIVTNVTDNSIAKTAGNVATNISDAVTIEGICFSNHSIFDINFFDFDANSNNAIDSMKKNVSIWYNGLRNLSTAALLCVLLYIGIRMALSTTRKR